MAKDRRAAMRWDHKRETDHQVLGAAVLVGVEVAPVASETLALGRDGEMMGV